MLLWAVPAFGEQKAALPLVVESIIYNKDFFARPWALWGYENHYLYDVNRLNDDRIGVSLIAPSGFEVRLVYDVNTLDIIYQDTFLSEKSKRETMMAESVSVVDAVKLAKFVVNYPNSQHKN
jgi:hypothetical protein